MPRKQDFSQSTVYHIRQKETKYIVYVGSSCNFDQRQKSHKYKCNNKKSKGYNYPIYVYIREHGDFDCYEVIPVSFHNFKNKVQLRIQEQSEIDKYPHAMNKNKAYITAEQKKEQKKELDKKYRATHSEQKKEYMKEYCATHAEQIKEYYVKNAEELNEKQKEYYAKNAEKINEKRNEKVECPCCKRIVSKRNFSTHKKTKICMNSLK